MLNHPIDFPARIHSHIQAFNNDYLYQRLPAEPDKWVLASAMQKAVRRGREKDAVIAALTLLQVDPKKLWHRLQVIGPEDVTPEAIDLMADIFWAASNRSWRKKNGGDVVIVGSLIQALCKYPHNRVANDLAVNANRHPAIREAATAFVRLTDQELAGIYLDAQHPIVERAVAARYLAGVQSYKLRFLHPRNGNKDFFLSLHTPDRFPPHLIQVIEIGIGRQEDHIALMALSYEHRQNGGTITYQNECEIETPKFGSWHSDTYDLHTGLGMIALKSVVSRDNLISRFLNTHVPDVNHAKALGVTAFALEGQNLKQREMYTGMDDLLKEAKQAYVARYKLVGAMKNDFFEIVRENFDIIHHARERVLNLRSQ
ncbi:MAG: hypothetical protein HYS17_02720 [Micavibrio aeruginosavorus]|uniref:Uncharacterized protein n=1 Tax=Micavibrio aeruginosavorus TaxID=349221 RepID=A0A7T5R3A2_9BACT|nr:MAG: hypothetical protein HYS17_02720 [Micavibrio aeruginosavorus]